MENSHSSRSHSASKVRPAKQSVQNGQKKKKDQKNVAYSSIIPFKHASHLLTRNGFEAKQGFLGVIKRLKSTLTMPEFKKEIPFRLPWFMKGTQTPCLRLYIGSTTVTLTASVNYTGVFTFMASTLLNMSDYAAAFDEYRVVVGEIQWLPLTNGQGATTGTNNLGVAVIDYNDVTALASFDSGLAYDTKKFIAPIVIPEKPKVTPLGWPMKFEPLPDQFWISTATLNTAFCYWKPFINAVAATVQAGTLTGWCDVQFRNSQ